MALERVDKLLASTGRWSRREIKDLIRQGRVWAAGRPVARPPLALREREQRHCWK